MTLWMPLGDVVSPVVASLKAMNLSPMTFLQLHPERVFEGSMSAPTVTADSTRKMLVTILHNTHVNPQSHLFSAFVDGKHGRIRKGCVGQF